MGRRAEVRVLLRWAGLLLLFLLGGVWGLSYSGFAFGYFARGGGSVWVYQGELLQPRHGGAQRLVAPGWRIVPAVQQPATDDIRLPCWLPFGLLLVPTALLWRSSLQSWLVRGHDAGSCAGCGYDLTGNESGVCPECGAITSAR